MRTRENMFVTVPSVFFFLCLQIGVTNMQPLYVQEMFPSL